jgi:hypothetical protein
MDDVLRSVAEVVPALAKLRHLITILPTRGEFDVCVNRIQELEQSLAQEFEVRLQRGRKRNRVGTQTRKIRALQEAVRRKSSKARAAERSLAEERSNKVSGRIQSLWFVRVGLSAPTVSERTLSQWCRDFPVAETKNISHVKIGQVRDAVVEVVKHLNEKSLVSLAAGAGVLPTGRGKMETEPFFVKCVHDEVIMTLKSSLHDTTLPADLQSGLRGKSSKIQNQVVSVITGTQELEVFTELQALHKKDGATIAFSLIQTATRVIQKLRQAHPGENVTVRVLHLVTGDAVNTNENACKRLLHHFLSQASSLGIRYSLVCVKCASHQANLIVQVAICGEVMANPIDNNLLCGTCSRLFKHLMPDYLEDFAANLRTHVLSKLHLRHDEEGCQAGLHRSRQLQQLYGQGVLPQRLLELLNGAVEKLEHVCPEGTSREDVCGKVFQLLYRLVLQVQSKPIVTRFFLFTECVNTLLLLDILGLPSTIFMVKTSQPQPLNSKRLRLIGKYFARPQTPVELRKAVLCLQLTNHAVRMTAQTKDQATETRPLIVRLAQGEVQRHTSEQLRSLVSCLAFDPLLDTLDALLALLVTEGHIVIRFSRYAAYPFKLWEICSGFNPSGYADAIESFVYVADEELDCGYALQLKVEAWAQGSSNDAVAHLMSLGIQGELKGFLGAVEANSFPAERKHNQDKRAETSKISGVARASRNSILQRYRIAREPKITQSIFNRWRAFKDRFVNVRALAIRKCPWWWERPRGQLWWEGGVSEEAKAQKVGSGNEEALSQFIDENRAELEAEALQIRNNAQVVLGSSSTIHGLMPYTNGEWLSWLEENAELFGSLLKEATAKRKHHSWRIVPDQILPAEERLHPSGLGGSTAEWEKKLLHSKPGFYSLLWGETHQQSHVFFTCSLLGEVWGLHLARASDAEFLLDLDCLFCDVFRPLRQIVSDDVQRCAPEAVHTLQLVMELVDIADKVAKLRLVSYIIIDKSYPKPKPKCDDHELDQDDMVHSDSDADLVSVASQVDDETADKVEEKGPQSASSSPPLSEDELAGEAPARATAGTHVIFTNGYFTLSNNKTCYPNSAIRIYLDCKIRILPKWQKDEFLGKKNAAKNANFAEFGDDPDAPVLSYMVLRAWMLGRMKQGDFHNAKTCRKKWFAEELKGLQDDVASLGFGGHTTGNPAADNRILGWAPEVLQQ